MSTKFNIRVYGLWIQNRSLLVSEERSSTFSFTKFPGGGLEHGEGTKSCLARELHEELGVRIAEEDLEHCYTTDFYQPSFFNPQEQIISIYYWVHSALEPDLFERPNDSKLHNHRVQARWVSLSELNKNLMTFPIDQHIVEHIISNKIQEQHP